MILQRERELLREHIAKEGAAKLAITYLFVLLIVIVIETFASYNIQMLHLAGGAVFLRDAFSMVAIIVAAFTAIANIVFVDGKSKADREFHYYFRIRPLLVFSATAIAGDAVAIFVTHNTSYPYVVFFTSLIAINLVAIGTAINATEKAIRHGS